MRAAILPNTRPDVVVRPVEVTDLGERDVVVRVAASGVCHSDRAMQLGAKPLPRPLVLGHETAGVVEFVGSGVDRVGDGSRVVVSAAAPCEHCEWCVAGLPQHCAEPARPTGRLVADGETLTAFAGVGGFASHVLVDERALVAVPDDMPLKQAALVGCGVLTGVGAVVNRARVERGESVVVLGCGGVGLNAVQGAAIAGAGEVIAVDTKPEALELAKTFGASHVVRVGTEDPVDAVRRHCDGVDHVIEAVGAASAIEQAWRMLRPRGTVTVVGFPAAGQDVRLSAHDLLDERRLQGSKLGSSDPRVDIPRLCQWYLDGRLRLDELVSKTVGLEDVATALADLEGNSLARTVVEP